MTTVTEHDAIVIGAGPAGSTAARELATRGHDVLMLDRARFPRDKPCGGAVTVRSEALLPFDLSPVVEEVITGAHVRLGGGKGVDLDAGRPIAFMTQRSRLDHFLAERAQQAGAEFRDGKAGRVRNMRKLPDGWYEVEAGATVHRSRTLVGADGANGIVGTMLGFEHPRERAVALEANLPYPDGLPQWIRGRVALQIGWMAGGYGWVFPKGDHLNVGVGGWQAVVGSSLRGDLDRLCRSYGLDPASMEQLRGHHLPMMRPGTTLTAGGALLVGDAAGFVDPLSGEGIYQAIASGIAAGSALDGYLSGETSTLAGYQWTVERELLPEVVASQALTELFHAWPRPFVMLMQRSGRFWNAMAETLTGQRTIEGMVRGTGPLAYALEPLAKLSRRFNERRYGRR